MSAENISRRSLLKIGAVAVGAALGGGVLTWDGYKTIDKADKQAADFKASHPNFPSQNDYEAAQKALTPEPMIINEQGDGVIMVPDVVKSQETIELYKQGQKIENASSARWTSEIGGGLLIETVVATGTVYTAKIFRAKPEEVKIIHPDESLELP